MRAPHIHIPLDVDRVAIRPREGIEVADLGAVRIDDNGAALVPKGRASHAVQPVRPARVESGEQLDHGLLALAEHHDVGTARQVLCRVVGGLGAAEHDGPTL